MVIGYITMFANFLTTFAGLSTFSQMFSPFLLASSTFSQMFSPFLLASSKTPPPSDLAPIAPCLSQRTWLRLATSRASMQTFGTMCFFSGGPKNKTCWLVGVQVFSPLTSIKIH
jgi:hypothetical protein